MLTIRLQRVGRKNDPSFRAIVTESTRGPKSGDYLEVVGSYNPRTHTTALNAERIQFWLSKGAQASDTLHNLLVTHGVIEGKKINVLPKKSPIKKEEENAPSAGAVADETADSPEEKEAGETAETEAGEQAEAAPAEAEAKPASEEQPEASPESGEESKKDEAKTTS